MGLARVSMMTLFIVMVLMQTFTARQARTAAAEAHAAARAAGP